VTAVVLAVGLIVGITLSGSGASAQTVESLRARAQQLANQLEELEQQSNELNEQYLELSERRAELEAELADNRRKVDEARQQVDAARGEAAGYLVEAYVGAGAHEGMALGSADPNDAVNSRFMLDFLQSGSELAANQFAATASDLEARSAELDATSRELEEATARQEAVAAELQEKIDRHDDLLASANSDLEAALEAERQRREAAEAARARAAAEQQAAAEAARSAAAADAPRAAAAPRNSTSGAAGEPGRPAAPAPVAAPPPAPAPVSAPNGRAAAAVAAAMTRLGTPYRWGGTTPAGFDCSGLMLWSWAHAGVSLPRTSRAQQAYTQRISLAQLQPGDLIFSGNPVYHVGMYIGGGQMIHSPQTGDVVKISPVRSGGSVRYGRIP
jgi:cell wall-associated NlpC family hydrolase